MDLSKYPLEKLVYFIAGIIPGFIALIIYRLAVPGAFGWLFAVGFLGYRTKLSLILLTAFLIGNSITEFLSRLLGMIGGALGGYRFKPPADFTVAPWRDRTWRMALKRHLGSQAPNDTQLISKELLDLKRQAVAAQPEAQRNLAQAALNLEKINSDIDDDAWAMWYRHYHYLVLHPTERSFTWHVQNGLNFNLQTSAVYVLVSALFVRDVRHWWCILPACIWTVLLTAEVFVSLQRATNDWSSRSDQIKYLIAQEPLESDPPRS